MNWAVYLIRNNINKKVYIGITNEKYKDIYDRFRDHINIAKNGGRVTRSGSPFPIYAAISKYGAKNFTIEYLENYLSLEEAQQQEIFYIEKYNSLAAGTYSDGYNLTYGGEDPDWDPDDW